MRERRAWPATGRRARAGCVRVPDAEGDWRSALDQAHCQLHTAHPSEDGRKRKHSGISAGTLKWPSRCASAPIALLFFFAAVFSALFLRGRGRPSGGVRGGGGPDGGGGHSGELDAPVPARAYVRAYVNPRRQNQARRGARGWWRCPSRPPRVVARRHHPRGGHSIPARPRAPSARSAEKERNVTVLPPAGNLSLAHRRRRNDGERTADAREERRLRCETKEDDDPVQEARGVTRGDGWRQGHSTPPPLATRHRARHHPARPPRRRPPAVDCDDPV